MNMNWSEGEQTIKSFLEDDLPYLIQSHYEDTIVILKKELYLQNLSLDSIILQYPNFLKKIKYHLFFFFAHQLGELKPDNKQNLYAHYRLIARAYHNQYVYTFVKQQLQDKIVQKIINARENPNAI